MEITALKPAEKLAAGHLITDVELADLLGVGLSTLRNWRCAGRGPRFMRLGGCVRYSRDDIEAFLAQGVQQ